MIDSSDIRRLLNSGCISTEQADQIKKLYGLITYPPKEESTSAKEQHIDAIAVPPEHPKPTVPAQKIVLPPPSAPRSESPLILFIKRNYLAVILSVLGAFLIIGGLSTLVVANWQNTPRWVKMIEAVVLMGGFWAGGFYLKEIQGKFIRTGIAFYVIGMCMWGICLKLYSFLYDVSSSPAQGLLLFTAGIAAFPWILRVKALFSIFMVSVLLWGATSMNDPAAPWACQPLVPLIGLFFWGLGSILPFIAKGYYMLYARMSKITGLGIFLFSLLYLRFQNWGEMSMLADFLPLALIGAVCILWDVFDETAPSPVNQGSKFWNRKTCVYGMASLLSIMAVVWVPSSICWIVLVLLSISVFFLSGASSRSEKITTLVFLSLLCLLPSSIQEWNGSPFFFHGSLIAPLVLAFSLMLRKLGNFTKESTFLSNVATGFYIALAGYAACEQPLLPNDFISATQMMAPWVFALTIFIRERDRESLIHSCIMICITLAALTGSTDAGFWVSTVLLIYLFFQVEKKCASSFVFALWLYGFLMFSSDYESVSIALPVLLIAFIKRGLSAVKDGSTAQNTGLIAVPLIEFALLHYAIAMIGYSLVDRHLKTEEWVTTLAMALLPLGFWAIEKWKEQDRSLLSIVRSIAFLLITPAMLFNSQVMFVLCLFIWAFLSIIRRASLVAALLENPAQDKQSLPFSRNTIFQSIWMFAFLILLTALSREVNYQFLPKYLFSWSLFCWSPVLPAIYTAAVLIYRSGNQIARRFYGTISLLIPAFSVLIVSQLPEVKDQNILFLCLFTILPWVLGFAILGIKRQWKSLLPGIATLLIMVTGLFLPEWSLTILFCLLLFVSFLGNSKQPVPFLIHGFGLLAVIIVTTNIPENFMYLPFPLSYLIPLPLLAGSLLLHNLPSWKTLPKLHLSSIAFLILCLLTTSRVNITDAHPSAFEVSIYGAIALACFIRLGINVRKNLYPSPIFAIIDTTLLIAMVASIMWAGSFATTFLMLAYGIFRVVTWKRFSFLSPRSSLITGCLFSFAVFISILSPLTSGVPASLLYIALLAAMAGSKIRHESENPELIKDAASISRIGQVITLAFFLPLCSIYNEFRYTDTSLIWLISSLLIPAWMVISSAISKRKFLPELVLLCLPVFLFIEKVPAMVQLTVFAICGLAYLLSGYRMEIETSLKKYRFETILGLSIFAFLPLGIQSCHGAFYNPLPFFLLYLPTLLMTAGLYGKPLQSPPSILLQKTGMLALMILPQFYCYTNNSTNIDWLTLPFFALPGLLMLIPLLANRKAFGMPLILLMVAASIAVPVICPNFSIGFVIASLILMGASFLVLGMKFCSASRITSGIIMMSLVSFSIIFRVFDSRAERGLSLLICGIAFLVLAFIAERTRHFLLKQITNQSTTNPS